MNTASPAEATTLSAGIGQFQGEAKSHALYLLELKNDQRSFNDFQILAINHSDGKAIWDYAEFSYQGLGFDFDPIRINLEIGWFMSLGKFVRDEVDYGISRTINGARVQVDLYLLNIWAGVRRYLPYDSRKVEIDSFSLTFNPETYSQARAGISIPIKNIEIAAEAGRFQGLAGRFDYLGDSYDLKHDPVSYGKASLMLRANNSKQRSHLLVEWHQLLGEPEDRDDFQKLLGTALQREIFDGGLVALGLDF